MRITFLHITLAAAAIGAALLLLPIAFEIFAAIMRFLVFGMAAALKITIV